VASDQLLNITNPSRLEEFRNNMIKHRNSAAAHAVTQVVSLDLDFRSLGARTAAAARYARTQLRRLQRTQAEAHASASAAPAAPQAEAVSSKRKRGGVGVMKKCGACGLHKSKETSHTKPTCLTHCLSCKTKRQDPEQKTGCPCQFRQSSCRQQAT
jgi:hypothetical protein